MQLTKKIKWRPRLRTILLIVNLAVLLLPIGGIYFFRFYENELVRQTESELISQAVFIKSLYKKQIQPLLGINSIYGIPHLQKTPKNEDLYTPIPALLNLASDEILPMRPSPINTELTANASALQAGLYVSDILKETTKTTLSGIRVTDHKGIIVASSRGELGMSYADIEEFKEALNGNYNSKIRRRVSDSPHPLLNSISRGTGIRIHVTLPIILNDRVIGTVMLSRSPKNILKALYDRRYEAYILAIMLISVVILLTLFTSYTINRPIHALIKKAKRITSGEKNVDLSINRRITREVQMLSDSINIMAQTIENRAEYIKQFANAVSHEFKTPLSSMGGTIELLKEHIETMSNQERDRFFSMIEKDTTRLNNLVQRLLELAKADVIEANGQTKDIIELLSVITSRYSDKGLDIKISNTNNKIPVQIAEDVLETIFINLFDNSLQHDASNIELDIIEEDDKIKITLQDNGKGIAKSNLNKIFTPFFTTKRENGGTGLGLDIVKSLLQRHGSDIRTEECNDGAYFCITIARNSETL